MVITGTRKILVVDDEPTVRDTLQGILSAHGYEAAVAARGEEALQRVAGDEFEVVLLDINMPDLSGIEVLRRLRASYPNTGVIMVTVVVDVRTAVEAMKLGAYDYVTKPLNIDELLVRVEKARERRNLSLLVQNHQKELEQRLFQQAKQIRETTAQAVQALIREELMARELEAKSGKRKGRPLGAGVTDVQELGAKILHRIHGGGSKGD